MYQKMMMRSLSLLHKCSYYFSSVKHWLFYHYEHFKQWFYQYNHSTWIFLPGYRLPLPLSVISNQPAYHWKYDMQQNQLIHHTSTMLTPYQLSLLSAKLVVTAKEQTTEYDMDSFLETFCVYTHTDHPPTLQMIVMTWSIYHKVWFPATHTIHMEYIDHLGNTKIVHLSDENTITIQQNKLYITEVSKEPTYQEAYPVIRPLLSLLS